MPPVTAQVATAFTIVAVLFFTVMPASPQHKVPVCETKAACKTACEKTKREIRRIQERMRRGYGAVEGEKMEAKLRELRARRSRYCR